MCIFVRNPQVSLVHHILIGRCGVPLLGLLSVVSADGHLHFNPLGNSFLLWFYLAFPYWLMILNTVYVTIGQLLLFKCLFMSFVHLKKKVLFLLISELQEFLTYSWCKSFTRYMCCEYFFQSMACLFSLMAFSYRQKCKLLMKSNLRF